jgi:membrane-associated protease RseP (regulator of RpoE activity)
VLTFSLGFGPELAGFNDRHGTRWKISAVPLGGYVKFFGDDSEASTPSSEALAGMSEGKKEDSNGKPNRISRRPGCAPQLASLGMGKAVQGHGDWLDSNARLARHHVDSGGRR